MNLYASMHWVSSLVGADTSSVIGLAGLAQHAEELGELLRIPANELMAAGYVRKDVTGHTVEGFGKQVFSRLFLDFRNVRICPECLRESGHVRQVWDFALVVACPHHGRLLLHSCPQCGKALRWGRSTVCHCDCGFDLTTAETPVVSEAVRHLMELFYVAAKEPSAGEAFGFEGLPFLRRYGLQSLTDLVFFLATWIRFGRTVNFRLLAKMRMEERIQLCGAVAEIFQTWPDGWKKAIGDFAAHKMRGGAKLVGLQKIFGRLYVKLFENGSSDTLGFLRDAFSDFAAEEEICRVLSSRGNPSGLRKGNLKQKYVTAAGAREMLGIGRGTYDWLIETGELKVYTQEVGSLVIHRIEQENLMAVRHYLDGLMSMREMADRLGVTICLGERLAKAGLLPAVRGKNVDGYRNWIFEPAAPEKLLSDLDRVAKPCGRNDADPVISIDAAVKGIRTFGVQAVELFQAAAASELPIFKRVACLTKLDDVLIRHRDILAFARARVPSSPAASQPQPA